MASEANGSRGNLKQHFDYRLHDIILVDQLPSDMWTEGVAVRPSGNVLTTRIEEPEILAINSASAGPRENEFDEVPPKLLHRFADASGCFNICPLKGSKREEYAVVSGFADLANGQFGNWTIWRVAPPPDGSDDPPGVTKISEVDGAGFLMGIVAVSERTLVVCDSNSGCLWRVDISTSKASVLFEDDSLLPPSSGEYFGVNRVRFNGGYGYCHNTGSGILYRFPTEYTDNEQDLRATGPAEEVASGFPNADGLVISRNGSAAYITSYTAGTLWRVDMDSTTGKGTVHVVRTDLVSPTAMELVYSDKREEPTLYIVCCGVMSAQVMDGERAYWLGLANLDTAKLQILVTTEISYSYEYV